MPNGKKKIDNECVFFVLKVYDGSSYHIVERSWADFSQLKAELLLALDAGHSCSGICPWLWEDLNHNFDYPTKKVNFRTWLQLRLRRRTKNTIQVFLEHFQELLDSMLHILRQRHIKCKQFQEVCQVLAEFIQYIYYVNMKVTQMSPGLLIRRSRASSTSSCSETANNRLDRIRVDIVRACVRLPPNQKKPDESSIFFILKVYEGTNCHEIEKSWNDFIELKWDLLEALDPGHDCDGICPWLWEDLDHNYDLPTKGLNLWTWLQIRLHLRNKTTIQAFLQHFQELLDSLIRLLRQRHIQCKRFQEVCVVLAHFLEIRPPTIIEFRSRASLENTRVEITTRISGNSSEDSVVYVLCVYHGTSNHTIEKSYRAFLQLKEDLLQALEPGHMCPGICPWLWEDLNHNFDRPKKRINLRARLQMRLHRYTPAIIAAFLEHFQELLDSLLLILRREHGKCDKFTDLCEVLAQFLQLTIPIDPHRHVTSRASI
ncbi:hypothetical protein THRCLA_02761 [Thraustotheca clavata]|uniref:PX domain-containing protein n=1 Tax=Thraustotheca clavata TaxID=74557 RepID=A0A1W0A4F4_9STRA|nr:hypothetical protein THRCLA_02761 [Thraustotheca clavata]